MYAPHPPRITSPRPQPSAPTPNPRTLLPAQHSALRTHRLTPSSPSRSSLPHCHYRPCPASLRARASTAHPACWGRRAPYRDTMESASSSAV
ncbi:uncharacterized protein K452DRAFT_288901 [Aplosporella prunicola CBS 121167]|uniref:Uncharacterized protein n=1 Tax=Aplosporella prunicola CBS 121167 TaxID=1176127 RepID=A0A6A6BCE0_9PEZI|nr:uncharacterized protein K452DRAFT_288901 [Aplosporella prunicola CBS 121167]KAF2140131.1 hypothetical protein K452DRAFT_288901 [Aplosporella prunicola CBS 121167]